MFDQRDQEVFREGDMELWRLPCVIVTPPRGACQGPYCPLLALVGTVRDIGLKRAMTLPDMW